MYKAKVTGKRQITIPMEVCDKLNVETGDQVEFIIDGDKILFQRVKACSEDICPYCNENVFSLSGYVTLKGQKIHLGCWYEHNK